MQTVLVRFEGVVHGWFVRRSIALLRISVGLVFLGFGALKFFPGVSPAEDLAVTTTRLLTFGLLPDGLGLVLIAVLECAIGLSLVIGRGLRFTVYLLAVELIGILSPLVLLPGRMFGGPFGAPTLEGQYVLKDIVLVTAAMVIATTFRGARITLRERMTSEVDLPNRRPVTGAERLAVVLAGARGEASVATLCRRHDITAQEYAHWSDQAMDGAARKLDHAEPSDPTSAAPDA